MDKDMPERVFLQRIGKNPTDIRIVFDGSDYDETEYTRTDRVEAELGKKEKELIELRELRTKQTLQIAAANSRNEALQKLAQNMAGALEEVLDTVYCCCDCWSSSGEEESIQRVANIQKTYEQFLKGER